jgi:GT2 family glycosyltransferase
MIKANHISLSYIKCIRSLILQRNAGIENATGDVVVFLDDDVILEEDYFLNLIKVYKDEWSNHLGGVQGVIIENFQTSRCRRFSELFRRFFFLSNMSGKGRLQKSGYPSFCKPEAALQKVEIFSGCMMSFRRHVLLENRFDESLRAFWVFDDVELSYRISRKYELFQTRMAQLHHASSAVSYEGRQKVEKMSVVNRLYLFRKYLAGSKLNWVCFMWASIGQLLLCLLRTGWGPHFGGLLGLVEGWVLVMQGRVPCVPEDMGDPCVNEKSTVGSKSGSGLA